MNLEVTDMENQKVTTEHERLAMRVSKNTIVLNTILSVFKLFAGVFAQ